MKIVIDAFGGDNSTEELVEGDVLAIQEKKDLQIILTGKTEKIKQVLNGREERIEIVEAPDIISNDDVPTEAIRRKKESSLVKAFDLLKENEDVVALVSAGSTGAILTGAIMKIGRIKGVHRPALAPVLPTKTENDVIIIDSGANIDCKPQNLYQFGIMGSAYYSAMYNMDKPKVGLLNIGVEEHKGTEMVREAYALLKKAPVNFVGNVEAREALSGDVQIIVADGFAGNVLVKGCEGAVKTVMSILKTSIKSHFWSKIGAIFMGKSFKEIKNKIGGKQDVHGGSPFLGCKKIVMKNHGSSTRKNILASVDQAITLYENKLIEKIEESINLEVQPNE